MNKLTPRLNPRTGEILEYEHGHASVMDCQQEGCAMHNPSVHPLNHAPQGWSRDLSMLIRKCDCNVWHPDKDSYIYLKECNERYTSGEKLSADAGHLEKLLRDASGEENLMRRKLRQANAHLCCEKRCCQINKPKVRATNPLKARAL